LNHKISFPKIRKVIIENFSLYKLVDEIEIDINNGIYCLAGANGLGKSTFISILNYGLTGIVINPRKNFASINQISKYYKENKKFADEYFDGRVSEIDRERSSVTIVFELNNFEYHLKRRFFEQDELVYFFKCPIGESTKHKPDILTHAQYNKNYEDAVVNDLKLEAFDQFVFLLYFLFTFDEARKLLFWDVSVLSRILHLVFGMDAAKAERMDFLKKEVARRESNMRNAQNAIYKDEKSLADMYSKLNKSSLVNSDSNRIIEQYEEYTNQLSELLDLMRPIEMELQECNLKIGDYSLKISALSNEYAEKFEAVYSASPIEKNQEVIALLNSIKNNVLKEKDDSALSDFNKLKAVIKKTYTRINSDVESNAFRELQAIDLQIHTNQQELNETYAKQSRLKVEQTALSLSISELRSKVDYLEKDNQNIISKYNQPNDSFQSVVSAYQEVIDNKKKEKEKETEKRDILKKELDNLEIELSRKYANVEEAFIPIFSKYANSFLGLDISIKPQKQSEGFNLSLSVNNSERSKNFQLSESQRYFIDIALRMALIDYWCDSGTIFIDTPEGSLDIAYESKAGKMFADFAIKGFDIIMTANINTSQLLIQMAEKCKAEKMRLERMTEWTILSDVQNEEHGKIINAFHQIENILNS